MKKVLACAFVAVLALAPITVFAQSTSGSGGSGSMGGTMSGTSTGTTTMDEATIREVQQQLKAAGFDPGSTSGMMDEKTQDALRQYQQSKGLTATGQLDEQTRQALLSGTGTGPGTSTTPGTTGTGSGSSTGSGTSK